LAASRTACEKRASEFECAAGGECEQASSAAPALGYTQRVVRRDVEGAARERRQRTGTSARCLAKLLQIALRVMEDAHLATDFDRLGAPRRQRRARRPRALILHARHLI